ATRGENTLDLTIISRPNQKPESRFVSEKQMLVSKVNLLRELKHPNIVRYYDRIIDWTNTTLYIVMEYCEGSDLSSLISRCITFLVFVMVLAHLKDITGHQLDPLHTTFVGTPYYMSPEQINRMSYNEKSDIWSLGCLLYELCALSPPFTAYNQKELAEKIREGKFRRIPYRYSEELNTLLVCNLGPHPACHTVEHFAQRAITSCWGARATWRTEQSHPSELLTKVPMF
uniref:non-specific serine/threonine protein kinase n=1 Tax=Astatotilapia calliptera TaxID=8154 RepID=A0A3P8QY28_ASTCA